MFFGSSKPTPPPPPPSSDDPPPYPSASTSTNMDSDTVKRSLIKQILTESNMTNARQLVEKVNETCFTKCIPKPGSSVSSSEQTCVAQCMEKYLAAWNQVNATYLRRIQQEVGNSSLNSLE